MNEQHTKIISAWMNEAKQSKNTSNIAIIDDIMWMSCYIVIGKAVPIQILKYSKKLVVYPSR